MRNVAFYTLGCKLNFSETSTIARSFEARGYRKVAFDQVPDIFIINTCSVTDNADKKCAKIVREAKKIAPSSFVAIIGCYAQLKPKEISNIKGVDAVLGAAEKFRMFDYIEEFIPQKKAQVFNSGINKASIFNASHSRRDRTRTFLKVQDGCNYKCAFCTIPLARGKSRSDSIENILEQANQIALTEVKEIVLTGVNVGDFGIQGGKRKEKFIDLLKALDNIKGINRFRISSIEPNLLTEEIIDFVAQSERFVPHFHIPLQSGSDLILSDMKRRYDTSLYAERIKKIKETMPDCCIGVDIITGFPGETKAEHLKTYNFLRELDVSYLHIFTYSEREKTLAASMSHPVPKNERLKRSRMLRNLSENKKRSFYETQKNQIRTVLFENNLEDGEMQGYTENYVRVSAKYDPMLINELKKVRLSDLDDKGNFKILEIEENLSILK
ncbi:MAG: tRNA (N(6)-L-threonylcarbamoyladenosine(37)-C(2))-methylthiotransferase MtaB [Flammeovirgaceae bacterium]|nr:tRNA (N(6)-L-threonylcarbamoyladenosine(37)-C(2))-methylthiotransferase MtaB [Flammeovirgaceae bacterium]